MRWFGIALMMASAIAGLIGWFAQHHNVAVVTGGVVFFIIGLIVFFKGK
jgi:hypothetical protein